MKKFNLSRLKSVSALFAALLVMIGISTFSAVAQTPYTFSNGGSITINDQAQASPYSADVSVAGVPTGSVARVTVKLKGFTHTYPDDVGVLLVSPDGRKVRVFTDCLGDGGGAGVNNIDITLDDNAASALPDNPSGPTPSGTYKPNHGTSDGVSPEHPANFASPAPGNPYNDTLAGFAGMTNANGAWKLYVDDDSAGDSGIIQNGWELTVFITAATPATAVISGHVVSTDGFNISGAQLTLTDQYGSQSVVTTNANGNYTLPALESGHSYILSIYSKSYSFDPSVRNLNVTGDMTVNWTGIIRTKGGY